MTKHIRKSHLAQYKLEIPQFFQEFCPYRWQFIIANNSYKKAFGENKKPKWHRVTKYPISSAELTMYWQDPDELIGLGFQYETIYALVDIDTGGEYHPNQDKGAAIAKLREVAETMGVPAIILIRSSDSGGLHFYIFFHRFVPVKQASTFIRTLVERAGLKIRDGQCELFPNFKNYDPNKITNCKAARLPLQEGSCILDEQEFYPISNSIDDLYHMAKFCQGKIDVERVEAELELCYGYQRDKRRYRRGKTSLKKWEQALCAIMETGWTKKAQTNFILGRIACHGVVFMGYTGQTLIEYIITQAKKAPGYEQYCNHQHEIERRAREYAKSAERYYWQVGTDPKREGTYKQWFKDIEEYLNTDYRQYQAEEVITCIQEAYRKLIEEGTYKLIKGYTAFRDALKGTIKKLFGRSTSNQTLTKHQTHWHPKHTGLVLGEEIGQEPANHPSKTTNRPENKGLTTHQQQNPKPKTPNRPENKGLTTHPYNEGFEWGEASGAEESSKPEQSEPAKKTEIEKTKNQQTRKPIENIKTKNQQLTKPIENIQQQQQATKPISKTNSSKSASDAPKFDKENLSKPEQQPQVLANQPDPEQPTLPLDAPIVAPSEKPKSSKARKITPEEQAYYRELQARHPEFKAFEEERKSPEYQRAVKAAFANARAMLEQKQQARKRQLNEARKRRYEAMQREKHDQLPSNPNQELEPFDDS